MEFIIIIIVLSILFFVFINKGNSKSQQSKTSREDYTPRALKPNDSLERWKVQHEQDLKDECERLNSGYYDRFKCLEFEVAGIHYRTGLAKDIIPELDILSNIHLIKDPTNRYDCYAVKIVYDRKRLGYVPRYISQNVSKLIDSNQIRKIFVINSGVDSTSNFSDALSVEIHIYYEPTPGELEAEKKAKERVEQEEREKQEAKAKRMLDPVFHPDWMTKLIDNTSSAKVSSDTQKWELKKLKSNIQNSIKSYEKAIREDKELIAENATKRLQQYKEELEKLLSKE